MSDRRAGGVPWKRRPRDERYAPVIAAALEHPLGTRHDFPPIETEEEALDARRGVFRSAGHAGYSANCPKWEVGEDGKYRLWFQLLTKEAARQAVYQRIKAGQPLAYNTARRRNNP
jgi:hypothetical protein